MHKQDNDYYRKWQADSMTKYDWIWPEITWLNYFHYFGKNYHKNGNDDCINSQMQIIFLSYNI